MNSIPALISKQLAEHNLGIAEFQRVIWRLLANQVLYCEQSQTEREIYYLYQRMEETVAEYLSAMGFRVYHDEQQGYVALFAPGAKGPTLEDEDTELVKGLRRKLNNDDICLLLLLSQSYKQAIAQGDIDENGCANISVEVLNQSFRTYLGRPAPTGVARAEAFRTANALRIIDAPQSAWEERDSWIKVRPVITSLAYADLIAGISKQLPGEEAPASEDTGVEEEQDLSLLQPTDNGSLFNSGNPGGGDH